MTANTAVFSVVHADPDGSRPPRGIASEGVPPIVVVTDELMPAEASARWGAGSPFTYREESRVFEETGMWDSTHVSVTELAEPGYFETMGNPLLAGRAITWEKSHSCRVVTPLMPHGISASGRGGKG